MDVAKLGTAQSLHTTNGKSSPIVGVSAGAKAQCVIVTVKTQGYFEYELETLRCVRNWSTSPDTVLTSRAVQLRPSMVYAAVQNGKSLVLWEPTAKKLTDGKSITFDKTIVACESPDKSDRVVLVFGDGSVVVCAPRQETHFAASFPSEGPIQWTHVTSEKRDLFVSTLVHNTKANSYTLAVNHANTRTRGDGALTLLFKHTIAARGKHTIATCSLSGDMVPSFSTSWSDGVLEVLHLPALQGDKPLEGEAALAFSHAHSPWASSEKTTIHNSGVAMGDCDGYVAIAGCQKGESEATLSIWDVSFGTMQCHTTLDDGSKKKNAPDVVQVMQTDDRTGLVVAHRHGVYTHPLYLPAFSMAAVLGKMAGSSLGDVGGGGQCVSVNTQAFLDTATVANDSSPQALLEVEEVVINQLIDESKGHAVEESEAMASLTDPKATPASKFMPAFNKFVASRTTAARDGVPASCNLSQSFVQQVTQRCLADKLWEALETLLKTHVISTTANRDLVSVLLENSKMDLLELAFSRVHNIPETDLVSVIQKVLEESPAGKSLRSAAEKLYKGKTGTLSAVDLVLAMVFAAPRNDVFLLDSVRSLPFLPVKSLLQSLSRWLELHMGSMDVGADVSLEHYPSFSQTIDWICILLDAHLVQLLLVPDIHDLLQSFHDRVTRQIKLCDKIQCLKGHLSHLLQKKALPTQPVPDYSVEVLLL